MNPRWMDKRVTILKPNNTATNELNEKEQDYDEVATVWASVLHLRGKEFLEAQKVGTQINYKVTIRYRDDIKPDMIVKYGDKDLKIEAPVVLGRKEGIELMCYEKVSENS